MQQWERNQTGIASGQYHYIERDHWHALTIESAVIVPLLQSAILAFGAALAAFTVVAVLSWIAGIGWKPSAYAGVLALTVTFVWQSWAAVTWSRDALVQREVYQKESNAGAQQSHETVTVQLYDKAHNSAYGRAVYDQFHVSRDVLALACHADRLSKRGLMAAGLSDSAAMTLLAQLLSLGYAARTQANEPARWTAKGRALARAFGGGGGGGGGREHRQITGELVE